MVRSISRIRLRIAGPAKGSVASGERLLRLAFPWRRCRQGARPGPRHHSSVIEPQDHSRFVEQDHSSIETKSGLTRVTRARTGSVFQRRVTDEFVSPEGIVPTRDEPKANRGVPEAFRGETKPSGARIGEPGRNRTFNQQIKSLLLCQLSYGPIRSAGTGARAFPCAGWQHSTIPTERGDDNPVFVETVTPCWRLAQRFLLPQRFDRVHPGCAPRRNGRGHQRHAHQNARSSSSRSCSSRVFRRRPVKPPMTRSSRTSQLAQ